MYLRLLMLSWKARGHVCDSVWCVCVCVCVSVCVCVCVCVSMPATCHIYL